MVYAHRVNRVTLSGTSFGGAEIWTTGFFLGETSADADPATSLSADKIRNYWSDYFQAANAKISSEYKFTQCKIALINADGHTDLANVYYSAPAAVVQGNDPTFKLPPQCALSVQLHSARPRGKASKGRMYLPGIASMPGGNGKLTSAQTDSNVALLKTFFDAVNADGDIPNHIILAARGTGLLPALTAQNDVVNSIKLGDVIDTQRRRRNGLVETYASRTLA